jgi:hypothetical protein
MKNAFKVPQPPAAAPTPEPPPPMPTPDPTSPEAMAAKRRVLNAAGQGGRGATVLSTRASRASNTLAGSAYSANTLSGVA